MNNPHSFDNSLKEGDLILFGFIEFGDFILFKIPHSQQLLELQIKKLSSVAKKSALVIGGGIAGLKAAYDIARRGLQVTLVEKSPFLGGRVAQLDTLFPTDENAKFYEVTKYIVLTDHVVNSVWPSINEKRWQSFSDIEKLVIRKAMAKARDFCAETNLKAESELVDFFKEQGLIVIEDPDKAAFAEYAKWSYQNESQDVSKDWDMDLYEKIQAEKR
jgi:glycine/D-amino acid oxidase-like deaminating enzyme